MIPKMATKRQSRRHDKSKLAASSSLDDNADDNDNDNDNMDDNDNTDNDTNNEPINPNNSINSKDGTSRRLSKRERYLKRPIQKAIQKFKAKPGTYLLIPCIAAIVGWFTNWLAVQMIFYPIQYRGIPLMRRPEVPLGLIGWQGIVPCKTRTMSEAMVEMVTTQLLSVKQVFHRLDPGQVADLLAPEVPKIAEGIVQDILPANLPLLASLPRAIVTGLPRHTQDILSKMNHNFLKDFTIAMQHQIDSLLNVRNCVVDQMLLDRTMLGTLFQKCGQKELDFLTNSGLWFGFFLGVIQMLVALFWDNPWTLSVGGGIVGLATNWLALKFIFEPVNPTKFGPFTLQGLFLTRQKEVAVEFSAFFADRILTSEKMFHSILTDPSTAPEFRALFEQHFVKFVAAISAGLGVLPEPQVMHMAAARAFEKLPNHIGVLHSYVDDNLQLRETLRKSMEGMTSAQFERVLHPIFEEDELTLILAGAVLGFAAGLVQQGLETGKIQIPSGKDVLSWVLNVPARIRGFSPMRFMGRRCVFPIRSAGANIIAKIRTLSIGASNGGTSSSTGGGRHDGGDGDGDDGDGDGDDGDFVVEK